MSGYTARLVTRGSVDVTMIRGWSATGGFAMSDIALPTDHPSRRVLQEESISISVGFASLETGESQEGLIARADAALLEVKRQGRVRGGRGLSTGLQARCGH